MTDCNGCGGCCDPVVLLGDRFALARGVTDARMRRWLLEDLSPMPYREAARKANAGLVAARSNPAAVLTGPDEGPNFAGEAVGFYRCRHFDPATRRCLSYDDRPEVCRQYPWLGGAPRPNAALPDACSYRADIGQPVTPVDEWLAKVGA